MTTKQAIDYFGGIRETAEFLGLTYQAVHAWDKRPPMRAQYEIEVRTKGKLKADKS